MIFFNLCLSFYPKGYLNFVLKYVLKQPLQALLRIRVCQNIYKNWICNNSGITFCSTLKMPGQDLNVNAGQKYNELILYSVFVSSQDHVPV